MDINTETKLKQQQDALAEKSRAWNAAHGITNNGYNPTAREDFMKHQKSLRLLFGEAAYKKAAAEQEANHVRSFYTSLALGNPAEQQRRKYGAVMNGSFKSLPLNKIFPTLKPKERAAAPAKLEKSGFTFEGQQPVAYKL